MLFAAQHSVEEIRAALGADSLAYLSLEALRRVEAAMKHGFCDACFSGQYPTQPPIDIKRYRAGA